MPGVRRIWGTLRNTPPAAVSATLCKLTTLGNQLSVRRKTNDISGRNRWWFLVKGNEEVLAQLEREWERVSLQTSWKLEPCTKPKTADDKPSPSDPPSSSPNSQPNPSDNNPESSNSAVQEVVSNNGGSPGVTDSIIPNQSQASTNHVPSTVQNQTANPHSFLEISQVTHPLPH